MDDDIGLRRRAYTADDFSRSRSLFWRLPLILKIIVFLMCAAFGLVVGAILWLIIGGLFVG